MIDIWLLFGLVLPFIGFLLCIFEELVVQKLEDDEEEFSNSSKVSEHQANNL